MAAHRYWRINGTAGNGNANMGLAEVQMRASLGGADETGSGTAAASTGTAANAFDNSNSTVWTATGGAYPHWLSYDFGAGNDKDIVEIAINCRTQIEFSPVDFTLQWSDDNSAWTTLFTIQGYGDWPTGQATFRVFNADRIYTNGASDQVWRLRSTAVDGGAVVGLSELMMYDASAVNQCLGGTAAQPISSSQQEGGSANTNGFDGVVGGTNRWSGWDTTEWLGYKFTAAKSIITVGITARDSPSHNQSPKDFVIERWDGAAWQNAFTLTAITGWTSGQTRYFNSSGETSAPVASTGRPVVFICT